MARRPPSPTAQGSLSADEMRRGIDRLRRRIADLEALDPGKVQRRWAPEVKALQAAIDESLSHTFGSGSEQYRRYSSATRLDNSPLVLGRGDPPIHEVRQSLVEGKEKALALINQAVRGLEEELAAISTPGMDIIVVPPPNVSPDHGEVFIVHGHDTAAKTDVARFIEKAGLKPVILHEQANEGRTIIEKFEVHGGTASFAVVLLTPDDVGGPAGSNELHPRARQNVIGEMFWFAGKLGRKRVCALRKQDVEIPSDFSGVVYTDMDDRGAWKQELLRELEAAGYTIDWRKALS